MDKMIINTSFTKRIIANFISKLIKKKVGYNVDIQINNIYIVHDPSKDDSFSLHLDIDGNITKEELKKLLNTVYGIGV